MNNLFAINSPIVSSTLLLLILLSIVTWSIALFKFWKQWQAKQHDREFNEHFWRCVNGTRRRRLLRAARAISPVWRKQASPS